MLYLWIGEHKGERLHNGFESSFEKQSCRYLACLLEGLFMKGRISQPSPSNHRESIHHNAHLIHPLKIPPHHPIPQAPLIELCIKHMSVTPRHTRVAENEANTNMSNTTKLTEMKSAIMVLDSLRQIQITLTALSVHIKQASS